MPYSAAISLTMAKNTTGLILVPWGCQSESCPEVSLAVFAIDEEVSYPEYDLSTEVQVQIGVSWQMLCLFCQKH